ncbi:MAG: hypothetical protein GY783_20530, partial [Gammaproteobacteria bacterium]|nr:hypothetical protein [Gammaproteobacteria bacterium]
ENETLLTLNLTVDLAAPASPGISSPVDGSRTNNSQISIEGTAEAGSDVLIFIGGVQAAGPVTAGEDGAFNVSALLSEGDNTITATATNRGGQSLPSSSVTVTLDTAQPDAPNGLNAQSKSDGQILLSWNLSSDPRVVSYDLYRSNQPFTELGQATRVNSQALAEGRFTDMPVVDDSYIYRVVARNELDTPSELSVPVEARADSQRPQALSITYTPSGVQDPQSGRMATGAVAVELEVNESLLTTPFLSLAPSGGVPIAVQLDAVDETHYQGSFDITESTLSGTAYAVFSARDLVGNRGDEILDGASLEIDTAGPEATRLTVAPDSPIKTDSAAPTEVSIEIELDQPVKPGTAPELSYLLSGNGRSEIAIAGLVPLNDTVWRGSFVLPADAGQTNAENLQFLLLARDDLDNESSRIRAQNLFQVYQGDLPPLAIPLNLSAQAQAGGQVGLTWDAVPGAVEYQLYRQAPGDATLEAYLRLTVTEYLDTTAVDGEYRYTVASVRQANGEESLSGQSSEVSVIADATAQSAPQSLTLELVGAGIKALWDAPEALDEPVSYNLYRSTGTVLTDLTGLTPVQTNIVADAQGQLGYIDTQPDENEAVYAVTAVDQAGNESLPSDSAYLNVDLLPVSELIVRQVDLNRPEIQWTHSGSNIDGYNIYRDSESQPLNFGLILDTDYTDISYTDGRRRYRLEAQDSVGVTSIARSVTLPLIEFDLSEQSRLRRGIMNRLSYRVENTDTLPIAGIDLQVAMEGKQYVSETFDLAPGEQKTVSVIVGGKQALPDLVNLEETLRIVASTGERAERVRHRLMTLSDDILSLRVETGELTRGTQGQVRFVLENSSEVETEILLSRSGNKASNEVRILLLDIDGNVLAVNAVQQATGDGVVTLSDGRSVARIAAGGLFRSAWNDVDIPQSAPSRIEVVMEIDKFHYHLGQSDAVAIDGMRSTIPVSLVDTDYSATVDSAAPASSFGDQPIVIGGQAIDRSSGQPAPGLPVKLVVAVNGFERVTELFTDASGNYQYSYQPLPGESGIFTVSAIHPDLVARPGQAQFTIQRVVVSPTNLTYRLPRNYQKTLNVIKATTHAGTQANNLRLLFDPADQPGGQAPVGISVELAQPVTLEPGTSAKLPITLNSDNSAADNETLVFKVVSDEHAGLATITLNLELSEARPTLRFSPNFVETGVAHEGTVTETVTFSNHGLADLTDMQLTLTDEAGSPAPSWLQLLSSADQGTLAIGESREIRIAASPPVGVAEGIHEMRLQVRSSNAADTYVNLFVAVTQSGVGSVLFKTSDIYTATLDAQDILIPGL